MRPRVERRLASRRIGRLVVRRVGGLIVRRVRRLVGGGVLRGVRSVRAVLGGVVSVAGLGGGDGRGLGAGLGPWLRDPRASSATRGHSLRPAEPSRRLLSPTTFAKHSPNPNSKSVGG